MTRLEIILTALVCVLVFFHCLGLVLDHKLRGLVRQRLALMDKSIDQVRSFGLEQARLTLQALAGFAKAMGISVKTDEQPSGKPE